MCVLPREMLSHAVHVRVAAAWSTWVVFAHAAAREDHGSSVQSEHDQFVLRTWLNRLKRDFAAKGARAFHRWRAASDARVAVGASLDAGLVLMQRVKARLEHRAVSRAWRSWHASADAERAAETAWWVVQLRRAGASERAAAVLGRLQAPRSWAAFASWRALCEVLRIALNLQRSSFLM